MTWRSRAIRATAYLLAVGLCAAVANSTRRAEEYGNVARYLAFAFVSFLASKWLIVAAANLLLGCAWLALVVVPPHRLARTRRMTTLLNRQLGHVEALFAVTIAVVASTTRVTLQAAAVLFALMLGSAMTDEIVVAMGAAPRAISVARRPMFYAITAIGLAWLYYVDRGQWGAVKPLAVAIVIGVALRLAVFIVCRRGEIHDLNQRTPLVDHFVIVVALCVAAIVPTRMLRATANQHARDRIERAIHAVRLDSTNAPRPDVSLFLVADNQFHDLERERMGVQLDAVSRYERVVARPVELDLLSGATLLHFGDVFRALRVTRPQLRWAHLGDVADIACPSELRRFARLLRDGWSDLPVAIAPGNHDVLFFGNFMWHPGWSRACGEQASGPGQRAAFAALLDDVANNPQRPTCPLPGAGTLPQVSVLGETGGRPILGIFVDTSDFGGYALGAAGVQGEVSAAEVDWISAAIHRYGARALVILFMHHPPDELSALSQARLRGFAAGFGPRLAAIVAAHTHFAAFRQWQVDNRRIPELVIGSTTDPPQEAALLELGPTRTGQLALQLRTIQSVSRQPLSVDDDLGDARVSDADCYAFVERWRTECPHLRRPLAPNLACIVQGHPRSPACFTELQRARAEELRDCVGNQKADPFDVKQYDELATHSASARKELVCLSWAASLALESESDGWNWRRFVSDDAFDTSSAAPPLAVRIELDSDSP